MSLYRHVRPVLQMREPATESQTSRVYVVIPSDTDPTPDHALGFRLLVQAVESSEVGATPAPQPAVVPVVPASVLPSVPVGMVVPTAPLPPAPGPVEPAPEEDELEEVQPEPVGASLVVETSADRRRWVPVHEPIDLEALPLLTEEVVLGPYVRARTLAESHHQVDVHLLGSASYRLELA